MLQLNELKVIGRITHDLELGQGKAPYLRFQVAVPRPYRKDAEPESDFINAAAFYSTAEYIDTYFGKGAPIYLNGSLRSEDYEDTDGNPRRSFTLMVNEAKFVLTKKEAEALAAYNAEGGSGGHEDTGRGGGRSNRNRNNGGGSGGRSANSRQNRRDNQQDGDGDDQGGGNSRSAGSGRTKSGNRSQGSGRSDGGNRSGRNGRSSSGSRQPDRNIPFDPDDDSDLPF